MKLGEEGERIWEELGEGEEYEHNILYEILQK